MTSTRRAIGPFAVQPIGLGCMNLDHAYGPPVDERQGEHLLLGALDAGYDFLDTATLYGGGHNEERLGRVVSAHRSRFTLASKCGMAIVDVGGKKQRVIDGRPDTIKRQCEDSLRRLRTDVIDLYYLHRWDKTVPIEDSVGALADLVRAGKIRGIGLSEVSAATLKRAHAVHPIMALQTEYSLWTRNPELGVLQACAELGVAFVAFSPVARGYLCGPLDVDGFDAKDIRRSMPRFQAPHWATNQAVLQSYLRLAADLGVTPAQLALAWVLHQAPHIVAIPGTTQEAHMRDNLAAGALQLDTATLEALNAMINPQAVSGERYDAQASSEVDTER